LPAFKPVYLIHGDEHGRIAERRARLRSLAEAESGAHGIEVLEGDGATPEAVAAALSAMTLALGRRFVIVEGVERWKEKETAPVARALETIGADTTVAFFAREDGRAKVPQALHDAVRKAGGQIAAEQSVRPWELLGWVAERGRELGLALDGEAARALVRQVGERQQRLLRELEKLALAFGEEAGRRGGALPLEPAAIEAFSAPSAERRSWTLADALLAGDGPAAVRIYLGLRAQGERLPGVLYWIGQRLRLGAQVASAIEAGQPPAQVKRTLPIRGRAADQLIEHARRSGSERLREAVVVIADLELASRGGGRGGAGEDSEMLLAIERITA
jgi:DNA polymerase-3 subunit delta